METAAKEKGKVTFKDWDAAECINSKEDVIAMLEATLEENAPDFLLSVIGDIARSKRMTKIARELNLDRRGCINHLPLTGTPLSRPYIICLTC
jgi:probable addiction module antidote protein